MYNIYILETIVLCYILVKLIKNNVLKGVFKMIITAHNSKGGCGKTTTIFNLLAQLFIDKKNCLAVDLDRQQDLTRLLFNNPSDKSLLDTLTNNENSLSLIRKSDRYNFFNVDVLPSSDSLVRIYSELQNSMYAIDSLLSEIAFLESQYEIVLIDLSNNLQLLESAIFKVSDLVIIPVNPGQNVIFDSFRTIEHIIRARKNPYAGKDIRYKVLLNSFIRPLSSNEPREQREIRQAAINNYGDNIFNVVVRDYAHFIKSEAISLPIPFLIKEDDTYKKLLAEIFKMFNILPFSISINKEANNG